MERVGLAVLPLARPQTGAAVVAQNDVVREMRVLAG